MTGKLFGTHTLKDEYHQALQKGMEKLLINRATQKRVALLKNTAPDVYIALAALAHEHGHAALHLGIRIAFPDVNSPESAGNT